MPENTTPAPVVEAKASPVTDSPIEVDAEEALETEEESVEASAEEPAKEKKEEPKKLGKKKYKLKVDGADEDFDLDLDNEEEVKKHLQLSKAAQKRMQETAEYKKQIAQFFDALKNDPISILSNPKLGIDVREMANRIINKEAEDMQKTPEQRELEAAKKELESIKKQAEDDKKSRDEAEMLRYQEQAATNLDKDISDALNASGLPKTARTVKYMVDALILATENDLDMTAHDVVDLIKKQTMSEFRELISALPEDALEEFITKDIRDKLRKRSIKNVKPAIDQPASVKATGESSKSEKPKERLSARDFFKPF